MSDFPDVSVYIEALDRPIGGAQNTYSDEILHRAGLSPVQLTQSLDADTIAASYSAVRAVPGRLQVARRSGTLPDPQARLPSKNSSSAAPTTPQRPGALAVTRAVRERSA